jgi:hypothetical protein
LQIPKLLNTFNKDAIIKPKGKDHEQLAVEEIRLQQNQIGVKAFLHQIAPV